MKTRINSIDKKIAFVMILTYIFTLLLVPCNVANAAAQSVTASYKSSDYFSESSVSDGPWRNQFYDFIAASANDDVASYKDMVATKTKTELDGSPTAWISVAGNVLGDYSWGDKAPYVSAKFMRGSTATGSDAVVNSWWESNYSTNAYITGPGRNYAVRTFTAPETGTVTVKAAESLTINGTGTNIRIMKIANGATTLTQVWPTSEWQLVSGTYSFEPLIIALDAGDKLTFECAYLNNGSSSADTVLSWDPVVEYVVSNAYKASEYFGSTNPNGPWAAMYYDYDAGGTVRSRYKNMEYLKDSEWINHDPTVTTGNYQWGNNSARIGETMMIADTYGNASDDEKNSVVGRDYPVRAFAAPNSGTITIKSEISTERENGAHIRIMKFGTGDIKGTQIWPDEGWENVTPGYVFSDITLDVNIGDVLTFENAFIYTKAGESPWDTMLNWNPIVEYDKLFPVLQTVSPEDASENIALNLVHTLTFDKAINTIATSNVVIKEEAKDGTFAESQSVCASAGVADDTLSLTFSGLKEYTKYEVTINSIGYAAYDASWVTSVKYTFTTGPVVDTKPATYDSTAKTVTVEINNSKAQVVSADMIVFVCSGTEEEYTVTNAFVLQRDDIGANDTMQIGGVEISTGEFLKVIVLKDILTAVPYGDVTVIGGE